MVIVNKIQIIPYTKEQVWNIMTDNKNEHWRSDLSKIKVIDDTHFIEYTKNNFPTYFTITSKKKYKEYRFDIKNANIKGKWTGILRELPNHCTELNLTEEIEVHSLLMKILAKSYLKKQQKRYLKDLIKELAKQKEQY